MIQLAIEEPTIENFFNNSKDEVMKALRFLVANNIQDFKSNDTFELSDEQKKELEDRVESFHQNRSVGKSWDEVKKSILT